MRLALAIAYFAAVLLAVFLTGSGGRRNAG